MFTCIPFPIMEYTWLSEVIVRPGNKVRRFNQDPVDFQMPALRSHTVMSNARVDTGEDDVQGQMGSFLDKHIDISKKNSAAFLAYGVKS